MNSLFQNLKKDIENQFPGIQFWRSSKHCVQITGDAVEVEYPSKVGGWGIQPDMEPPVCFTRTSSGLLLNVSLAFFVQRISQKDVDIINYHRDLSHSGEDYPPRIRLIITSSQEVEDAQCFVKVVGVSERVEFLMQLKREKHLESSVATLPPLRDRLGE